jgi:uncharacterized protein (DUF433 family)
VHHHFSSGTMFHIPLSSGAMFHIPRRHRKILYTAALMARVKVRRTTEDIRELPSYSITEAAYYLGIPPSTLKTWFRGYRGPSGRRHPPMLRPADGRRLLLSFYNLVEAHILEAARRRRVSTKRLRIAVEWANDKLPGPHPLLTHEFKTAGKRIFVQKLAEGTVEASRYGQVFSLKMAPTLKKFLKSIVRGPDDLPIEIHPIRPVVVKAKPPKGAEEKETRVYVSEGPLAINPKICSGRPIVKGTDVLASILSHRAHASESLSDLARDYDMDRREVYKVVKYLDNVAQGPHVLS